MNSQVLTCILAMISMLRSQKANNFQVTIGLFLLASGASKREIAVMAHAGLSLSYPSILSHLKLMSAAKTKQYMQVMKEWMCALVWDNLNIPFTVGEQRLDSKNHFDNGTTATLVVLYGGSSARERLPHGYLPLSMKPRRTTTRPVFDWSSEDVLPDVETARQLTRSCLWQIKRLALEHIPSLHHLRLDLEECPEVRVIPPHKTEQYALPAMHKDESSIDGTIDVHDTLYDHLELTDEALEKHGLMPDHGDLLTDSLKDNVGDLYIFY